MMEQDIADNHKSEGFTDITWIIKEPYSNYTTNSFNIEGVPNIKWFITYTTFVETYDSHLRAYKTFSYFKLYNENKPIYHIQGPVELKLELGVSPETRSFVMTTNSFSFFEQCIDDTKLSELYSPENFLHLNLKVKLFNEQKSINKIPHANFEPFLFNAAFSDVVFQIGDETFPAHKIMLASVSPVFEKMFSDQMTNIMNIIEVAETDPNIFKELLSFIYTGEVKNLQSMSFGLYELANKYDMPRLQLICEDYMRRLLSVDNAVFVFELADRYNSKNLKEKCIKYIDKHFSEIGNTEAFTNMRKELLLDLFFAIKGEKKQAS